MVQQVIDAFKSHGHTELDTARMYGEGTTEQLLSGLDLSSLQVDSKCYPVDPGDHSPENLRKSLETSLAALKVPKLRIFYLHAPDRATPFADTLRECDKLYKEGKFEILGLSNFAAWEVAELCGIADKEGLVRPKVYQGMYNAITRSAETELIPCCRKLGLRLVVYNPIAGGFFAGKVPDPSAAVEKGSRFDPDSRMGKMYRARYFKNSYFSALQTLKERIAALPSSPQPSLTAIALRWVQHHSLLNESDGVIIGASSLDQCQMNCRDSEGGPLSQEVLDAIEEAWETVKVECPPYFR